MESRVRRSWTAKEDALLRRSVQKELDNKRPLLWRELAKHIPGRSNKDCRKRWWNSLAGSTAKGAWSPEEDRRLIEAVEKYGTNNWMKVAGAVGTRCGDQCSGHWRHVLNPNINYCDWTPEEDKRLLDAIRIYGTNWSTIASFHTPERTTLALKNQYWKLRQRSQKAGKACPARPDGSESSPSGTETPAAATGAQTADKTIQTPSVSSNDDDDDDENVQAANPNDQSETEGPDADVDMHANEYEQQADPNCWLGDWPGQKLVSSKSLVPLTPLWTGYHAKTGRIKSGETWMEGLDEEGLDDGGLSGDSSATPLYAVAGEQYASGPLENQRPDQLAHHTHSHTHTHSHSAADDDAMYLYLANLDDSFPQYSPAHLAMPPLPPITTTAAPLAAEGEMPMSINLSPVSLALDPMLGITHSHTHGHGHGHTASVSSTGDDNGGRASTPSSARNKSNKTAQGGGETADTLSHSVSIKFSCTTGQLSNIMSLLASTGLPVNMKIDTE